MLPQSNVAFIKLFADMTFNQTLFEVDKLVMPFCARKCTERFSTQQTLSSNRTKLGDSKS